MTALPMTGICMTERERTEWEALNKASGVYAAKSPCSDCLIPFHKAMMAEGTCDGKPRGINPRNVRAGVATKWDDKEWAAKERKRRSEAATKRNRKPGQRRRRPSKYAGMRCQHDPCRAEPVSTSSFTGRMLCRKHSNLEAYHRNK